MNATLKQAKELEGAGNYDQAITILQQATQVDPNQDLVWAYLGDAQRGAKKYPDAVESYQRRWRIKPTSGPYMSQLADAYAKSGQTDKAVQQYAAAAQADPANAASYYYNEGAVLTNTGKIDEAIAAFDKAIATRSQARRCLLLEGRRLDRQGHDEGQQDGRSCRERQKPSTSIWSCSPPASMPTQPNRCWPASAPRSKPATSYGKTPRSSSQRSRTGLQSERRAVVRAALS